MPDRIRRGPAVRRRVRREEGLRDNWDQIGASGRNRPIQRSNNGLGRPVRDPREGRLKQERVPITVAIRNNRNARPSSRVSRQVYDESTRTNRSIRRRFRPR